MYQFGPYVPRYLPCGVEVNKAWRPGAVVECCSTVCRKSDVELELCYQSYKDMIIAEMRHLGWRVTPDNWVNLREELLDWLYYGAEGECGCA